MKLPVTGKSGSASNRSISASASARSGEPNRPNLNSLSQGSPRNRRAISWTAAGVPKYRRVFTAFQACDWAGWMGLFAVSRISRAWRRVSFCHSGGGAAIVISSSLEMTSVGERRAGDDSRTFATRCETTCTRYCPGQSKRNHSFNCSSIVVASAESMRYVVRHRRFHRCTRRQDPSTPPTAGRQISQ